MANFLLKESYHINNLKISKFKDLWGSHGVFTTIRLVGKPGKLVLFNNHFINLIKSLKKYKIYSKNIEENIKALIIANIKNNFKYNHLFRIALSKKLISISIRKRLKPSNNFELKVLNYKRIDPKYKNLQYKYILKKLNSYDATKVDILLVYKKKILETCTSNLLLVRNNKYYSPKNNCYIGNTINYLSKKVKINFKDINLKDIHKFDEILLIGSGKGVTPVKLIRQYKWRNKSVAGYKKINKYLKFLN
ncbi:aminotransferase class IV [Candidatus Pelagibacter sp.]|nr:aminotransferase class IV [Candidatus Pelagibacter sp.]